MSTTQRIKKIAATKIRNAILDNHLEDFFEYFKMTSIHDKPSLLKNIFPSLHTGLTNQENL